jgi:hypothetical protein
MLNSYLSDALVRQQTVVEQLKTTDTVGAVITLTRSTALAITTAGTNLGWNVETRNYQFTWNNASVIIPEAGWYLLSVSLRTSALLTSLSVRFRRNNQNAFTMDTVGTVSRNTMAATALLYCEVGDGVSVNVLPSANVNIEVFGEFGATPSPIFHVVQLSGPIGD